MTKDKRLWYCKLCDFYHYVGSICPRTGQTYETMTMLIPIAKQHEETKKIELPKVKKRGQK